MIEAQVKYTSSLKEFERRFALPLVELGRYLLDAIRTRARRGQGAAGPMAPLGAYAGPPKEGASFWAAPGRPHPKGDGYLTTIARGEWAGWSLYRSYRHYAALYGHGAPRDIEETGRFWSSLAVRVMSGAKVKVAAYGSHVGPTGARLSNGAVGYLASRREPLPLLHPTRAEVAEAGRIVFAKVDGQAIEAAAIAGLGGNLSRKAASVQRRASKLLGD